MAFLVAHYKSVDYCVPKKGNRNHPNKFGNESRAEADKNIAYVDRISDEPIRTGGRQLISNLQAIMQVLLAPRNGARIL